jgi:acetylglutamate kinase
VSGKDGPLIRARKLHGGAAGDEGGGEADLGLAGEVVGVNGELLELLLDRGYVPVISPLGLGEDGQGYHIHGDSVAAEIAVAIGASKLIYLGDAPGILVGEEVASELRAGDLERLLATNHLDGRTRTRLRAVLRGLQGGVERVHLVDGRTPHSVIAELFTDRGVGTLVTA